MSNSSIEAAVFAETCWTAIKTAVPFSSVGDVHVYRFDVDRLSDESESLRALLSPPERERAERFHFAADARRYLVARGMLRRVLAVHLSVIDSLELTVGAQGKPQLGGPHAWLRFNATHAKNLTLLAVASHREVGIDIERMRPVDDSEAIAAQFLTPAERLHLSALPPDQRSPAFLRAWTRKEAWLKATGCGLSVDPRAFETSFDPHQPIRLLHAPGGKLEIERWSLCDLSLGSAYCGTFAAEGRGWRLRCFDVNRQGSTL